MIEQKNILFLSPFFYPEPISTGKFNSDIALALSKNGHQVTVLCFHPLYPDWKVKESNEKLHQIKIIRGGKNMLFSKKTVIRRFLLEVSYSWFILKNIKKYQKNIDVVIAVFPPSLYLFSIIPLLSKKLKIVGMVHDLQQLYVSTKKGFLNRFVTFFINKVEKKCFNACDKLVFLSEEMKNEAEKMYGLNPNKCSVQYPFHSLKGIFTDNLSTILKQKNRNIVYSGALGEKQNPTELIRFFEFATDKIDNVEFHVFSQGSIFDSLKFANRNSKIKFHDLVAREHLEELYLRSNLQIIPQKPNTSKGSFPSKLANLLASGCNILLITDKNSELENFFSNQKLQTVITTWNFEVLLSSVQNILSNSIDTHQQKKIAKELFTIDEMIVKILF